MLDPIISLNYTTSKLKKLLSSCTIYTAIKKMITKLLKKESYFAFKNRYSRNSWEVKLVYLSSAQLKFTIKNIQNFHYIRINLFVTKNSTSKESMITMSNCYGKESVNRVLQGKSLRHHFHFVTIRDSDKSCR